MSLIDDLLQGYRLTPATDANRGPAPHGQSLVAILTCMDTRLQPEEFISPALRRTRQIRHVIRNAGGRASDDALRSLIVSSRLLHTTEVMVVQHTDCGMLTFTNDEFQRYLTEQTGADASGIDFLPIVDLEESVRADIAQVRACPFIAPTVNITGFIYDLTDGRLRTVQTVAVARRQ